MQYQALVKELKAYAKAYVQPISTETLVSPFNFYLLADQPLIVYTTTNRHLANVFYMSGQMPDKSMHFIVGFSWDFSSSSRSILLAREYRRHQQMYPQHSLVFICNAQEELEECLRRNLPALWVNKNAFHDLDRYRPLPEEPKHFDAIMNARMAPFKRVELASEVDKMAVITSLDATRRDAKYHQKMRGLLCDATWLNYKQGTYKRLSGSDVAHALNQARVGIILSAVEGQCQASIEYLLTGLPVVSTKSRGGRDVFFDEEYVAIVEATPVAVREGGAAAHPRRS